MTALRLGTKVLVLCFGIALGLAASLTALGYSKVRVGLREQAEAAMAAEARSAADAMDRWNEQKLHVLKTLATASSVRQALQAGDVAHEVDELLALAASGIEVGLEVGDVIHEVNRKPVESVDELRKALQALKPGDPLVLLIERQEGFHFLATEME